MRNARDAKHYERLLKRNPNARVGINLAAAAVYAARYGQFTPDETGNAEWRAVYHRLARYGDSLSVEEVLAEMQRAKE